ncbi:uncharacterized protein LOC111451243 [Cucurbita moschata]|uniref:Uncharacterized protein LOC111451243 n=1 Tax=Cucurbita moschata TaxID=3662 RepID=A0A6J1G668_CUCMO|nr:uncharacterized protein LOC111451243 [Cucurbita moschata]
MKTKWKMDLLGNQGIGRTIVKKSSLGHRIKPNIISCVQQPFEVLGEMNDRVSARESELVLVCFSQEGRDLWLMVTRGAEKMLLHRRLSGLNPEVYGYLIAMTVLVKEFNELAKALHKLEVVQERG